MEKLNTGPVSTLVQNTIYALPSRRCLLFCTSATPTLQQSNSPTFADTPATITLVGGQAEVSGSFIRATSAGPNFISLERA